MALFLQQRQNRKQEVIDAYYEALMQVYNFQSKFEHFPEYKGQSSLINRETEKYREKEKQAAIDIQKNWRMLKVKWHYQTILKSCRLIQRVFKGYIYGRKVFFRKQEQDKRGKQMAFFHEMAKIIQKQQVKLKGRVFGESLLHSTVSELKQDNKIKILGNYQLPGESENALQLFLLLLQAYQLFYSYRGYYSRKYEHDFYARKNYLNHVQEKNEEVRKKLEDYSKHLSLEEQKRQEATARTEFAELAGNLHHLCSTKAIPGVYNAPYAMVKPQAFNVEIETHLRSTFKSNYQWKPPNKEKIEFFRTLSQEQQKIMQQQKIVTR